MRSLPHPPPERGPDPPDNPFARGDRGLDRLPPDRLRALLARYRRWQARLDAERGVWPPPETARLYVAAVIDGIESALAGRAAT